MRLFSHILCDGRTWSGAHALKKCFALTSGVAFVFTGCSAHVAAPDVADGTPRAPDHGEFESGDRNAIDDAVAIFVAATFGDDAAPGTSVSPVASIRRAIELASSGRRVYVCATVDRSGAPIPYVESLDITSHAALYGHFDCTDRKWASANVRARIESPTNPAIRIRDAFARVMISSFDINAAPGQSPSESSVAIFASNASNVVIRNASLRAGNGARGVDGISPANFSQKSSSGLNETFSVFFDLAPNVETEQFQVVCPDGSRTVGGYGESQLSDARTPPSWGLPRSTRCPMCGAGWNDTGDGVPRVGDNGIAGPDGTVASTFGTLTSAGWVVSRGGDGDTGTVGQGGGGARRLGSNMSATGFGAGGGAGGCGGRGGSGGSGGGASIALLAFRSGVGLHTTTLIVGAGGAGGNGGLGQTGQRGGDGGMRADEKGWAASGGSGGNGGAGAGGRGGIAIGALWLDGRIDRDTRTTVVMGRGGRAGCSGARLRGGEEEIGIESEWLDLSESEL